MHRNLEEFIGVYRNGNAEGRGGSGFIHIGHNLLAGTELHLLLPCNALLFSTNTATISDGALDQVAFTSDGYFTKITFHSQGHRVQIKGN